ncbi:MAG: RlmE family RNA methyltransferase [Pseudomonadota bacterium]
MRKDKSKNNRYNKLTNLGGNRQKFTNIKTAKGRKISSTQWLQRQLNDPYVKMAKQEGFRSRAAFKLLEINEKFSLIKPKDMVIDLGAAPGGWSQIAVDLTKSSAAKPTVIGIDLLEIEPISGAHFMQADFTEEEAENTLNQYLTSHNETNKVNVVLSDMAASATGHSTTDHIKIIYLCEIAFDFAKNNLLPNGNFVAKILQGGTEQTLLQEMKKYFKNVKHYKPAASRSDSAEMYVIATGFKDLKIS